MTGVAIYICTCESNNPRAYIFINSLVESCFSKTDVFSPEFLVRSRPLRLGRSHPGDYSLQLTRKIGFLSDKA